jgi:hypothetical protein
LKGGSKKNEKITFFLEKRKNFILFSLTLLNRFCLFLFC